MNQVTEFASSENLKLSNKVLNFARKLVTFYKIDDKKEENVLNIEEKTDDTANRKGESVSSFGLNKSENYYKSKIFQKSTKQINIFICIVMLTVNFI